MEKLTDVYTYLETEDSADWFKNGRHHREGGEPASIDKEHVWGGRKQWIIDGKYSRENGLPHIEYHTGALEWHYPNGTIKRVIPWCKAEEYFKSSRCMSRHRDERDSEGLLLPALIERTGVEYYLDDVKVDRHDVPLEDSSSSEEDDA
jgi:hypothetical protein